MKRLSLLYPQAGHNAESLNVVAWEWARMLDDLGANNVEFADAMAVVKRRCRFFPTPADVAEALRWVREHPPRVPEERRLEAYSFGPDSEERRQKTQQAIAIITAQLTKQITPEEASRRIAALGFRG